MANTLISNQTTQPHNAVIKTIVARALQYRSSTDCFYAKKKNIFADQEKNGYPTKLHNRG